MANERITVAQLRAATGDPGLGEPMTYIENYAGVQQTTDGLEATLRLETDRIATESRAKTEAAERRQRDEDAALADADEIVRRMRTRNGRKVCSSTDGRIIRQIWELLRSMSGPEVTTDDDPSFRQ